MPENRTRRRPRPRYEYGERATVTTVSGAAKDALKELDEACFIQDLVDSTVRKQFKGEQVTRPTSRAPDQPYNQEPAAWRKYGERAAAYSKEWAEYFEKEKKIETAKKAFENGLKTGLQLQVAEEVVVLLKAKVEAAKKVVKKVPVKKAATKEVKKVASTGKRNVGSTRHGSRTAAARV